MTAKRVSRIAVGLSAAVLGLCLAGCTSGEHISHEDTTVNESSDGGGAGKKRSTPPPPPSASRKAPPKVAPVVIGAIRYEQVLNAELIGADQRTGILAAYDNDSNERLWTLKVYDVQRIEHLEADVQDRFFTKMALGADGRSLEIDNERGERYAVDPETRSVSRIDD